MNDQDSQKDTKNVPAVSALSPGELSYEDMQARSSRLTQMAKVRDQFILDNLKKGTDFGKVEGCGDKKVLLKSGAEKLMQLYGYYADVRLVSEKVDHNVGLFAYVYRADIKQIGSNIVVGTCEGDASSHENKYRYTWAYDNQIPEGVDKSQLRTKTLKSGKVMYRVVVDNPADRCNTYRKMAQKRAIVGGVVLATASSSLFATDIEVPEDDESGAGEGTAGRSETSGNGNSTSSGDHGNPISEKQAGLLWHKLKAAGISEDDLNRWLQAEFGWSKKEEIGWKKFDEILKMVESGSLVYSEKPKPQQEGPKPATAKATVPQIKLAYEFLNENHLLESKFTEWLAQAYPQFEGCRFGDLPADAFDSVFSAYKQHAGGENS